MSINSGAISVRTVRLNNIVLGNDSLSEKTKTATEKVSLNREVLLDAFTVLYDECSKENSFRKDEKLSKFVNKFRTTVQETSKLRVNIQDFGVQKLIEKGNFGDIYLVTEKETGDKYAMKKIPKSTTCDVNMERDIMAFSSSEWIVQLQYSFYDTDYLYMIMEYMPGGDLYSLIQQTGPFDEKTARFYLAEMTQAVNALHGLGYVHRDIKPENILLDRCGHLKLADFGTAVGFNKDGSVTSVFAVGTGDYVAPEVFHNLNKLNQSYVNHDESCDFWAIGIIGYQLVTDSTPFRDDNFSKLYSKITKHCDNNEKLAYPGDIKVSDDFRDLIDKLVTKQSRRIHYKKIVEHDFFKGISWNNLRYQVPPIIPETSFNEDDSNMSNLTISFNDTIKNATPKKFVNGTNKNNALDVSTQHLPFIGFSFVHNEGNTMCAPQNINQEHKLKQKIKELQNVISENMFEIKELQDSLLKSQHNLRKSTHRDKMLTENKSEMEVLKEKIKQMTVDQAASRTEVETLKSHLKVERENSLKNEAKIKDIFRTTQQKYEKDKYISEKQHEKKIIEKNDEISNLNEKLVACETKLRDKLDECTHLEKTLTNYKELLKNTKSQINGEKSEYENCRQKLIETYEKKLVEMKSKLKAEKDAADRTRGDMANIRQELNETLNSSVRVSEARISSERKINELKAKLNQQIDENEELRRIKSKIQTSYDDLKKSYECLEVELENLRQANKSVNRLSDGKSDESSNYKSARSSLTDNIEDHLRRELDSAKESVEIHRKKVQNSAEIIQKLEEVIQNFNQHVAKDGLEKQYEKLEDKLAAAREQAIIDRQSARTANLALWKLEKQIDDEKMENKSLQRKLSLAETNLLKIKEEKIKIELELKQTGDTIKSKETQIAELNKEINSLKYDVKKEHRLYEESEKQRTAEKNEIVENLSKIHMLEEKLEESKRKLNSLTQKNEFLTLENRKMSQDLQMFEIDASTTNDVAHRKEQDLTTLRNNYELLKQACEITEVQLGEMENMLETEVNRNKLSSEKIADLWTKISEKDDLITTLRTEVNTEKSAKLTIESKFEQLKQEFDQLNREQNNLKDLCERREADLDEITTKWRSAEEKLQITNLDVSNIKQLNTNYDHELISLKEENAKILTDLFLCKEELNKINRLLKESQHELSDAKQENDHLNQTMAEMKSYYSQRDIKFDETIAQQKKLIEYLQVKNEQLEKNKKKSLADILFGANNSGKSDAAQTKHEKSLQEELWQEKERNKNLTEQLLRAKTDLRELTHKNLSREKETKAAKKAAEDEKCSEEPVGQASLKKVYETKNSLDSSTGIQHHRFEMNVSPLVNSCDACSSPIINGNTHWSCKECKTTLHRKCRTNYSSPCNLDTNQKRIDQFLMMTGSAGSINGMPQKSGEKYCGNLVLETRKLNRNLKINTIYEIDENTILLGCDNGLYSYHMINNELVQISGIESVDIIAVTDSLSKALLVGSRGEKLFQCDLRHLRNRGQALSCLKPKLETQTLDFNFMSCMAGERWHFVELYGDNENLSDAFAIAATPSRIVILKYDVGSSRFCPLRALDTACPISSVLFTAQHTVIVCSDKFFEIDLKTFQHDEFLDHSDSSILSTIGCKPMAAFQINKNEFLFCFMEFGIFVDAYGCRSRTNNLVWNFTPNIFIYRDPFLFVAYDNQVHVIYVSKSFVKEQINDEVSTGRTTNDIVDIVAPRLMIKARTHGVYAVSSPGDSNDKIYYIEAERVLKKYRYDSMVSLISTSSVNTFSTVQD